MLNFWQVHHFIIYENTNGTFCWVVFVNRPNFGHFWNICFFLLNAHSSALEIQRRNKWIHRYLFVWRILSSCFAFLWSCVLCRQLGKWTLDTCNRLRDISTKLSAQKSEWMWVVGQESWKYHRNYFILTWRKTQKKFRWRKSLFLQISRITKNTL